MIAWICVGIGLFVLGVSSILIGFLHKLRKSNAFGTSQVAFPYIKDFRSDGSDTERRKY